MINFCVCVAFTLMHSKKSGCVFGYVCVLCGSEVSRCVCVCMFVCVWREVSMLCVCVYVCVCVAVR